MLARRAGAERRCWHQPRSCPCTSSNPVRVRVPLPCLTTARREAARAAMTPPKVVALARTHGQRVVAQRHRPLRRRRRGPGSTGCRSRVRFEGGAEATVEVDPARRDEGAGGCPGPRVPSAPSVVPPYRSCCPSSVSVPLPCLTRPPTPPEPAMKPAKVVEFAVPRVSVLSPSRTDDPGDADEVLDRLVAACPPEISKVARAPGEVDPGSTWRCCRRPTG